MSRFIFEIACSNPLISRDIDLTAFSEYLTFAHTIPPQTILKEVKKLPVDHIAVYVGGNVTSNKYWDIKYDQNVSNHLDKRTYIAEFKNKFFYSVKRRLMSDVPLGVFLSSGVDSSSIVAAMSRLGIPDFKTPQSDIRMVDTFMSLNLLARFQKHLKRTIQKSKFRQVII
jgi:asparagine synthase (glutamine-hydrolysing)